MNRHHLFAACAAALLLSACSDSDSTADASAGAAPAVSGTVADVNEYGQLVPTFTPAEMSKAGFDYSDLVDVTLCDTIHIKDVPYVTSFNEVGAFVPVLVDYNALGTDYGFGLLNGNFHQYIGGKTGDKIAVKLSVKGGYKQSYELLKSIYPIERRAEETAEEYANFREVKTTGMGRGVLYRSSNPLNSAKNPGRYAVVDSLARVVGVKAEIDLADTPEKLPVLITAEGYTATYCPQLYREGKVVACGMDACTFGAPFKAGVAKAVRFMLDNEPPYLLHCNEGKDRCGFVSMLLEAFMGASVDELRRDYMVTMLNFYRIPDGGESYQLRQRLSIDRMLWMMCNEYALDYCLDIDWDNIDVYTGGGGLAVPGHSFAALSTRGAAKKYLQECGLTDEEIDALSDRLGAGTDADGAKALAQ